MLTRGNIAGKPRKAVLESNNALEDPGAVVQEDSPWKRSKRQGLEKAIAAIGRDGSQGLVSQFKKATSIEVGDGMAAGFFAVFFWPPQVFFSLFLFFWLKLKKKVSYGLRQQRLLSLSVCVSVSVVPPLIPLPLLLSQGSGDRHAGVL